MAAHPRLCSPMFTFLPCTLFRAITLLLTSSAAILTISYDFTAISPTMLSMGLYLHSFTVAHLLHSCTPSINALYYYLSPRVKLFCQSLSQFLSLLPSRSLSNSYSCCVRQKYLPKPVVRHDYGVPRLHGLPVARIRCGVVRDLSLHITMSFTST